MVGSPLKLRVFPAAWGAALHEAHAGQPNRFWVRLSDEGNALPGSQAGRKLMHSLQVCARAART